MFANRNQALSEYKHSLTFRVRCCVVIATKHVHRLQIRPIVHNQRAPPTIPSSYIRVRAVSSMGLRRGTDKHTDDRDQYTFLPRLRLTRNVINRIFVNNSLTRILVIDTTGDDFRRVRYVELVVGDDDVAFLIIQCARDHSRGRQVRARKTSMRPTCFTTVGRDRWSHRVARPSRRRRVLDRLVITHRR